MKIKKLLLPFLMGVVMNIASIVPVILSIMAALALNALMAGKGALVLTGLMGKHTLKTLPKNQPNERKKPLKLNPDWMILNNELECTWKGIGTTSEFVWRNRVKPRKFLGQSVSRPIFETGTS
jgi:hypothetical protein